MEDREKWDKEKIAEAVKKGKDEFIQLEFELANLIAKFGLRALQTFQTAKNDELNPLQVNEIVAKEIEAVKNDLSLPAFIEVVISKVERDFYNGSSKPIKPS